MTKKTEQTEVQKTDTPSEDEMMSRFFNQTIETFIKPEIENRRKKGKIDDGFELRGFQIIMNLGQASEVRLNKEIKIAADVKVNKSVKKGDLIRIKDVTGFHGFMLTKDDENAGHITGIIIDGSWILSFNFQRNTQIRQEILDTAEEFLKAAESSFKRAHYKAFHENLFSAMEAAVKATLIFLPDENLLSIKKHSPWKTKINLWNKQGNINADYVDLYNSLFKNRNKARYSHEPFIMKKRTARKMLKLATEFISELKESLPKIAKL